MSQGRKFSVVVELPVSRLTTAWTIFGVSTATLEATPHQRPDAEGAE